MVILRNIDKSCIYSACSNVFPIQAFGPKFDLPKPIFKKTKKLSILVPTSHLCVRTVEAGDYLELAGR